jgi:SUMO ligase MMS21 Smc5/6 complex component
MPLNDDGPLRRDLERLSRVVETLTSTIEKNLERIERIYVRQDVYHAEQRTQDDKIEGLSSMATWAIRIVLGAVIVAVLSLVVTQTGGT